MFCLGRRIGVGFGTTAGVLRIMGLVSLLFVLLSSAGCTSTEPTVQAPTDKVTPDETLAGVRGNTPGNIVNGGIAAEQDDWVYYVNNDGAIDAGAIYRMRGDGTDNTKIASIGFWLGASDTSLNVMGDWIYYQADNGHGIYKVRTDGTEQTQLVDECDGGLNVIDGWMYYVAYDEDRDIDVLYKVHIDGTEKTELVTGESLDSLNVADGWIYYTDVSYDRDANPMYDGSIFKVRTDGTDKTVILAGQSVGSVNVVDDWIYYSHLLFTQDGDLDHAAIYKARLDGSQETKLVDGERLGAVNVASDWVFFADGSFGADTRTVYKIGTDGNAKTELAREFDGNLNVAGDWIYYVGGDSALQRARTDGSEVQVVH